MKPKLLFLSASFFFFLVIQFSTFPVQAQDDKASDAILQIMDNYPVVGLSVAVVKDNKLVYTQSFGLKDIKNNIPLTNDNIFRIASISKSFTVTSLMQLVQKRKLKLSDDVSKLIGFKVRNPRFPDKVITLRMILSHTSSLNDSEGYFNLDVINPDKNAEWEKCYSDYAPGEGYRYCNLNFNIAGTILERYSGERFDYYVVNHVLKPLNIYGGYNVNDLDASRFANLYEYDKNREEFTLSPDAYATRKDAINKYVMGYSTPIFSPTGGMKISAIGLARYMMMHMNNGKLDGVRIISAKNEKRMRKPLSDDENYGLALLTTEKLIPGEKLIGHTGSAYGLFSSMFFEPKKKFGIVVICNGCEEDYTNGFITTTSKVINALYENIVKEY